MKCANCLQTIQEGEKITHCVNSGQPLHEACANPCVECKAPLSDMESLANKFRCNKCMKSDIVQIDAIRRSHIENYRTCPYMFKKLVIDEVEVPNNPYAESGIILHDLFDKASKDSSITREEMIEEYADRYGKIDTFNDKHVERGVPQQLYNKGVTSIDNFIKYHASAPKDFDTEKTIQYEIAKGLPKIQITFDRVNKVDGQLHLVDYKTGKVYYGKRLASDLQIPTYIMAVKEHYGIFPETFTLLFLSEDAERIYNRVDDNTYICKVRKTEYVVEIQKRISEIRSIFSQIKQGNFDIPTGKLSPWYCENMCSLHGTHCAGVEDQPWLKYNK